MANRRTLFRLVVTPVVVHTMPKVVVEQRVAVFMVMTRPEQNLTAPVRVVVSSIDELEPRPQVHRARPHGKGMSEPLLTRHSIARVLRRWEVHADDALARGVSIGALEDHIGRGHPERDQLPI